MATTISTDELAQKISGYFLGLSRIELVGWCLIGAGVILLIVGLLI